jgi:hypothetical protein
MSTPSGGQPGLPGRRHHLSHKPAKVRRLALKLSMRRVGQGYRCDRRPPGGLRHPSSTLAVDGPFRKWLRVSDRTCVEPRENPSGDAMPGLDDASAVA